MVFYERDRQLLPSYHNKPFYVTTYAREVDLRPALIDPCFALNIIPSSKLTVVTSWDIIVEQLIKCQVSEAVRWPPLAISTQPDCWAH